MAIEQDLAIPLVQIFESHKNISYRDLAVACLANMVLDNDRCNGKILSQMMERNILATIRVNLAHIVEGKLQSLKKELLYEYVEDICRLV